MKFISKRLSKRLLQDFSLPVSLLDSNVLVEFNGENRIVSKSIAELNISDFVIKAVGLPLKAVPKAFKTSQSQ